SADILIFFFSLLALTATLSLLRQQVHHAVVDIVVEFAGNFFCVIFRSASARKSLPHWSQLFAFVRRQITAPVEPCYYELDRVFAVNERDRIEGKRQAREIATAG